MTDPSLSHQILSFLEGTWTGEGRGEFPAVNSFDYRETLVCTRRDEKSLSYEQRTWKRYDGQTDWLVSHWENGFIRLLEGGELELINVQSGGRMEALLGKPETRGPLSQVRFRTKVVANDSRVVRTARTLTLEGSTLRYEMEMQTTSVDQLTHHLRIVLQRRP